MKYSTTKKTYLQPTSVLRSESASSQSKFNQATSDMILGQLNQRKVDTNQAALNSAALQDHIVKSFNLKQLDPFRKLPPRQPVAVRQTQFTNNAKQILSNIKSEVRLNRQAQGATVRSNSQGLGSIMEDTRYEQLSSAQSSRSYM